ncbi:unnamed protein product, partial [Ectocarpus sp. 12 AP-2014]
TRCCAPYLRTVWRSISRPASTRWRSEICSSILPDTFINKILPQFPAASCGSAKYDRGICPCCIQWQYTINAAGQISRTQQGKAFKLSRGDTPGKDNPRRRLRGL